MNTPHTDKKWFVSSTGNHQGLVIDETDGRNVAVTYDKADAPLIAAAPELLAACTMLLTPGNGCYIKAVAMARAAIANAKGTP